MAVFGVSITKTIPWRGVEQPFSNVYHYRTDIGEAFQDDDVIAAVVAAEKAVMGGNITFRTARTWGDVLAGPVESVTRVLKDLTGSGSQPSDPSIFPEMAVLVTWELVRADVRGRKKYLRKWIHPGRSAGFNTNGSSEATVATRDAFRVAYADKVTVVAGNAGAQVYELCSPRGEVPLKAPVVYRYMEHRQLGDQWR